MADISIVLKENLPILVMAYGAGARGAAEVNNEHDRTYSILFMTMKQLFYINGELRRVWI